MKPIFALLTVLFAVVAGADEVAPEMKYLFRVFGVPASAIASPNFDHEKELEKIFPEGMPYKDVATRILDASRRMKYAPIQVRYGDMNHQLFTEQPVPEYEGAHTLSAGFITKVAEGKELLSYHELCFAFSCDGHLLATAVCFGTRRIDSLAVRKFEEEVTDLQQAGAINYEGLRPSPR